MFTATKDPMLPATVTGSWPRPRWSTASMWGRPLDSAMMDPWFREQFTDAHASSRSPASSRATSPPPTRASRGTSSRTTSLSPTLNPLR